MKDFFTSSEFKIYLEDLLANDPNSHLVCQNIIKEKKSLPIKCNVSIQVEVKVKNPS